MARFDLTKYVIHFVHQRNSVTDPSICIREEDAFEEFGDYQTPDGFTYDGKPIFLTDLFEEREYDLPDDASAFEVLMKILHDGYIKAGWSYRGGRPTIYGPKAAVCFTEMPLYGLIEYARLRGDKNFTERYGIAFLKDELFHAGARPVIYGLSGDHVESNEDDLSHSAGYRTLASECGISIREQYRYVYTSLFSLKRVDWTHEREWRWADLDQSLDVPGMPFYLINDKTSFARVVVIVETVEECKLVIDRLKNLFHSKSTNRGREYNLDLITNTRVLALEELAKFSDNPALARLDDLPLHHIPKISKVYVPQELMDKVKNAVAEASEIFMSAMNKHVQVHGDSGLCGWSHVVAQSPNSKITEALITLKLASSYAQGLYYIRVSKHSNIQSIDAHEAGATAAAEYLTQVLGEPFSYESTYD